MSLFLQIVNCLEEWQTGTHIKIPFSGDRYEGIYQGFISLIDTTEEHDYHGDKLHRLLSSIAIDGRYVNNINVFLHFLLYSSFRIIEIVHHVIVVILGAEDLKLF
jgi:hypothetical protein